MNTTPSTGQQNPLSALIIGGSGFVSGTLTRTALEAGHQVWAVTRGQRPLETRVNAIMADRSDREAFAAAIAAQNRKWDLVVDCIGYAVEDARQDIEVFRERAKHFVFISTDFVFDPASRRFPQGEVAEKYSDAPYGGNKRLCELEFANSDTGAMAWTVLRPCHIYGPGSALGCLPQHGRDGELIARLRAGETLKLVGGGHFLQQPIFAADLAQTILSCAGNEKANGSTYMTAGPEIIESAEYYRIIAEVLGCECKVEELSVTDFLAENPDAAPFLCHRIYDLSKQKADGLAVPQTTMRAGLAQHVQSLLAK